MLKNGTYSAHELQRIKVQLYSFYGVWSDSEGTIEFKISPSVGGAKIKVWTVRDFSSIEKISVFCGLHTMPKRTNWQGFDLVTNLEKKGDGIFVNGQVNMPNNKRRNFADFRVLDDKAYLEFYYRLQPTQIISRNKSGRFELIQKKNHADF